MRAEAVEAGAAAPAAQFADSVTARRGQMPKKEKAEPVSLRQVSQWQRPVRIGSPRIS